MGKITEALKKVKDERIARIQRKPDVQYVVKRIEDSKIDEHIVSFHDPSSLLGEQYKMIRTNIQTLKATKDYKAFLITSATSGEGKTVTSINLAMTMAHDLNNKSILLIDADMRKGKVAKYLGISSSPGLSEILKDGVEPDLTFVSPNVDNLTIIPSGKTPRNPSELLGSRKTISLIASLKTRFDYIFVDSPPVLPLTDPCILGSKLDGVIMVIQAGRTQLGVIKHAENRLHQAQAKTIGYIMTNVEYHLPQYLYRYVQKYDNHYSYEYETVNK